MNARRVLVVEDEVRLAAAIGRGLGDHGFTVELTHDGDAGYRRARQNRFEAIVLDLMLPGLPGIEVCRGLRREGIWTPILVLTAMDGDSDETRCLDAGADDYLRKPFSFSVLLARCRALVRRGPATMPTELVVGDLVLDPRRRAANRGGTHIALTRREFALLEHLMRHHGEVCSKEQILEEVWGGESRRDPNLVEVYIGYLRRKVDQPFPTALLDTVRGRGYRLTQS